MGARNSRVNPTGPTAIPLNAYEHGCLVNWYWINQYQQTDVHFGQSITVRLRFSKRDGEIYIKLSFNGPILFDKRNTFKEGSVLHISIIQSNRNTNWDTEYIKWYDNLASIKLKYDYHE